jgi:hypothetical protein
MKALRYFFCIVLPPLAVLMTGRIGSFFLSLILVVVINVGLFQFSSGVVRFPKNVWRGWPIDDEIRSYSVPGVNCDPGLCRAINLIDGLRRLSAAKETSLRQPPMRSSYWAALLTAILRCGAIARFADYRRPSR